MKSILHIFLITLVSGLAACGDDPTCVDRDSSIIKIDFLGDDGLAKDISILSISAPGNNDGFPELRDTTLNKLQLPLNPAAKTSTFIIEHENGSDTIGFKYNVVAQLISPECGLDATFSNLDTTLVTFPQAIIISDIINVQIPTNIEITH